jgi:excisionase family DNA binding protein
MSEQLKLLTRKDLAALFQLAPSTLDFLVATRQIPFYRISKRNLRFKATEIKKWLETRKNLPYGEDGESK